MKKILYDKWVIIFHSTKECVPSDPSISNIFYDSKTIIDDTVIFSNHIHILLHYFSCVAQVFAHLHWESTGECRFDCKRSDPRLMPVIFNSCTHLDYEKKYHSSVGDIACGRWAISRLRKYLWGTLFYWICDCNPIKGILEYNGSIHQIKRWSQESLAYEFVVIHRLAAMIQDVDGVSRYIYPLIHWYTITASRLHVENVTERPFAYSFDVFHSYNNPRHVTASDALSISITITTYPFIPILYHTPIKFSTIFSIRPVIPIEH